MTPAAIGQAIFRKPVRVRRGFTRFPGHDGIDYAAAGGTPIYALAGGTVTYARNATYDPRAIKSWAEGGGNQVSIDVGGGFWHQYAHLSKIAGGVRKGQHVGTGALIGFVGSTGNSTGAHLHFGVWDRHSSVNRQVNPSSWGPGGGSSTPAPAPAPKPVTLPFIDIKEGKTLTAADVDGVILAAFDKAGTFDAPVVGQAARSNARGVLMGFVGRPWNKATRDAMQAALNAAAETANPLNMVPDVAGAIAGLGDALGGVAFTLVILGGIVGLLLLGAWATVKGSSSPTVIVRKALT